MICPTCGYSVCCNEINIKLPPHTELIHEARCTIIGRYVKMGDYCKINQNVTIGCRHEGMPTIEHHVALKAGCFVLGDITIGCYSIIGAGAVVLKDVPSYSVVVGNPARIVNKILNSIDWELYMLRGE